METATMLALCRPSPTVLWRWLPALVYLVSIASAPACRRQVVDGFPRDFVGIGLELNVDAAGAHVVKVLSGGAAQDAGVMCSDQIVAVDGESTLGSSLGDVVMRLRGVPDSQVAVTVERNGQRIIFVVHRRAMKRTNGEYRPVAETATKP